MALKRKASPESATPEPACKSLKTVPVSRERSASPGDLSRTYPSEILGRKQAGVLKDHQNRAQKPVNWFVDNCMANVDEQRVTALVEALKELDFWWTDGG